MNNKNTLAASSVVMEFSSGGAEKLRVLKGVDLEVKPGETVSVMGASGAGKSTLLHILGALEKPTSGTVTVAGNDVYRLDDIRRSRVRSRSIGFVFQAHYLLDELTALENVSLPMMIQRIEKAEAEERSSAILADVGLSDRKNHRPVQLSGGERQRVALARALAGEPDFLLADEPTGNLDRVNGEKVMNVVFEQVEKRNMGLVLVTHDESIAMLARSTYLLKDGILENSV